MPRGRPRNPENVPNYVEPQTDTESDAGTDFDPTTILDDLTSELKINSQFLCENYFSMAKELKKDLKCIVCLEQIDCRCCFTILKCGHFFHSSCLLRLEKKECPTCRDCSKTL